MLNENTKQGDIEIQTIITIPTSESYDSISTTIKPLLIAEFLSLDKEIIQLFLLCSKK